MSKNRRKRKKSVAKHVNTLTFSQQNRLIGLVDKMKETKPNRRSRRSRRKNPEQKYSGFHVSERLRPRIERKSTLFDALREGSEYRLIDELDELEQLKSTPEVRIDPKVQTEIENRIEEIKEELPASLLLSMTDANLRDNLKNLRTRESQRAAKKYSRRRLLSTRERMRAFLAAIIVMGYTPVSNILSRIEVTSRSTAMRASGDDGATLTMLAEQFEVPLPTGNTADAIASWLQSFVNAIPVDLSKIDSSVNNTFLFTGDKRASGALIPEKEFQYGGQFADAVLLALPPEAIREARERLDEIVEPNLVSSMTTASVMSKLKRAKQRLDAMMGTGRILNTAKYYARRALNPRGRARNPQNLGDVAESSLTRQDIATSVATALVGGTIGYVGTGLVHSIMDTVLAMVFKDDHTRRWINTVISPVLTSGLAAWGVNQMGEGNAQNALAFVVAGSGARALHDVGDLTLSPKDATYRFLRESVGLSGCQSCYSSGTHGYEYIHPVFSGYSMNQPAMHGYQY